MNETDGGISSGVTAFFWSIVDEEDSVEWTGLSITLRRSFLRTSDDLNTNAPGHTKGSPDCVSDDPPYKEHKEGEQNYEGKDRIGITDLMDIPHVSLEYQI